MEGNTATNVTTGKPKITGAVFVAPKGTPVPTDATSALSEDYINLGFVSDSGLENSNDMSVSSIKEWGGLVVYNSLDELTDQFKLVLIEAKYKNVLKAAYGDDNVTESNGTIHVEVNSKDPQERVCVFDLALRGGIAKRIVIKTGAVTARDAITYNASDPVGYGLTVSAYPDENGKTHDEYIEVGSTPSA